MGYSATQKTRAAKVKHGLNFGISTETMKDSAFCDEFMVNKYIVIWCGIEMSFVRMLTFDKHVATDAH